MRTPTDTTSAFDGKFKAAVRRVVVGVPASAGYGLEKLDDTATYVADDSTKLPEMVARLSSIPGMLPNRRCLHLYLLALGGVAGDVIEIGSWMGRSTAYLAQACADSDNGVVHAIDTFRGNPGSEENYVVDGSLDNLEQRFRDNIAGAGLTDHIVTYAMTSAEAAGKVLAATAGARLIFIDGMHSYEAVSADLRNYAALLLPGGLLVFDDYSPTFAGDVRAVHEHIDSHPGRYGRPFQQKNTLVLPRRHGG